MALSRLGISNPKKMVLGRAHSNSTETAVTAIKVENSRYAERIAHDEAESGLQGRIQLVTKKLVQVSSHNYTGRRSKSRSIYSYKLNASIMQMLRGIKTGLCV